MALMFNRENWLEEREAALEVEALVRAELDELLMLLIPADRILLEMRGRNISQDRIAGALGCAQPSVCNRETRVREWVQAVVPIRMAARGCPEPVWGGQHPQRRALAWRIGAWHHRTSIEMAAILGCAQSTAYHHWAHACTQVMAEGLPDLVSLAQAAKGNGWQRPSRRLELAADSMVEDEESLIDALDLLEAVAHRKGRGF